MNKAPRTPSGSAAPPLRAATAIGAFSAVLVLLLAYLVPHVGAVGEADDFHWGLADFRDAVYFPCRAVLDGVNPYDPAAYRQHFEGGIRGTFNLYSPLTFILFTPLACFPLHLAGWLFTALNLGLLLICALLCLRWCGRPVTWAGIFALGALILASQPGQTNLNYGQVTWPLVLGSYLALALSRSHPKWSGAALALASFKPTYAVVVGFFMLCRGDYRSLAYGVGYSIVGALGGLLLMFICGVDLSSTINVLGENQREFYAHPGVEPTTTSVRVDLPVLLVKAIGAPSGGWNRWLPAVLVMGITAALMWRETRARESFAPDNLAPDSLATFLLCLGAIVGVYRIVYDILLLTLPATALFLSNHPSWRRLPRWGLAALRTLVALLAMNFLWTGPGVRLGRFAREILPEAWLPSEAVTWHLATLANPLLLAALWILAVALCLAYASRPSGAES